ncbi:MAG: DUF4160 domain-containing protein [Rhodospirillaceae bacterium]|nr:DUF4160 domain-containing protein [Rhodospirillaceae bacterium]
MVTVFRAQRWKIAVYGREHGLPHFHIEGPGYRCSVAIMTNEPIIGSVPPSVLERAQTWAAAHRSVLLAAWKRLNP